MTDTCWATKWLVRPRMTGRVTGPGRRPRARNACPECTATRTMPETWGDAGRQSEFARAAGSATVL